MPELDTRPSQLRTKYGDEAFAAGLRLQPATFERQIALRNRLDQHFTKLRLDFATLGLGQRRELDERTRLLVLIAQFTMVRAEPALEDAIRAAFAANVPVREVLEIILHRVVYGGDVVVDPALRVFSCVAEELGLLEDLSTDQLPLDGRDRDRSLEAERQTWHPDDVNDPRREELMARHGWLGVSNGLRLRPKNHLNVLGQLDALDVEFADLWLKFCYQGMYTREVVDHKTRLLCMLGDCMAIGDADHACSHIRDGLHHGIPPREMLEVIFQSCVNFGMPIMLRALRAFINIMAEEGRLDEIGNPARPGE